MAAPEDDMEIVRRTNKEFALLIRRSISTSTGDSTRILRPTKFGPLGKDAFDILTTIELTHAFWKEHGERYNSSIRKLHTTRVVADSVDPALLMYFDTVLAEIEVIPPESLRGLELLGLGRSNIHDPYLIRFLTHKHNSLLKLLPYLEADTEVPAAGVWFQRHEPESILARPSLWLVTGEPKADQSDKVSELAKEYFCSVMKQICQPAYAQRSADDWLKIGDSLCARQIQTAVDLHDYFNTAKLGELLRDVFGSKRTPATKDLSRFIAGRGTRISAISFRSLLGTMLTYLSHFVSLEAASGELAADFAPAWFGLYQQKAVAQAETLTTLAGMSEQFVAAKALVLPPFRWFRNIAAADALAIRQDGGLEDMRTAFRDDANLIRFADIDRIPVVAEQIHSRLSARIKEHEKEMRANERKLRKLSRNANLSLGGNLLLGFLPMLIPQLSLPAAVFAAIYGGKSVLDVVKLRMDLQTQLAAQRAHPLAILARYRPGV